MVSTKRPPTKSSAPVFQIFHLVLTILSIAVLSYKVFRLESELSFIREELSTCDRNGDKKTNLPLFTTARSEIAETRSDRYRRQISKSEMYGVRQKIENAVCIRKALQDFQVKHAVNGTGKFICLKGAQGPPGKQGARGRRGRSGPAGKLGPPGARGPRGAPGMSPKINVAYIEELTKRMESQVTLFAPPRFSSKIPSSISVREGNNLSLRISASGNPVPKITCSLQSKIQGNGGRILVSNEKLEMRNVRFLDQGKIECLAENVFGTQVARVKLIVFGPPRFSDTLPGKVTGFLGKTTKLLCDVVGFPTPVVEWNMSPPAPLPQGRSSLTNGSLFIENIKSGDEGVYLCTARNKHGMVIHGTFLKVESVVPPEFSKTPSSSISAPGIRETLRISCSAKGSPLPTVTWYKNDFNVINVMNNVTNDEFTSELVINAFQPEDQGTYSCIARNVYNDTVNTNSRVFLPNCGNPVNIADAMIMKSNNWAGEFVRYLCHPGYTMIGPAVRRCLPSGKWSGENTSCTDRQECFHHTIIDDDTRRVSYDGASHKCDDNLTESWYRFQEGRQMNTNCAKFHSCDTERAGWLVGGHPSAEDGRVTKKVCFGRTAPSCTCAYHTYIQVRNCGSFYVYKLKPITVCKDTYSASRYCTN